ncbi:MAG: glycosyltransferase family 2 protein [Candidatus Omnitrophica bacterium]|nr:glycosyltransferase family 2 protein [Candidatus Omnitrophota bacterium]MDD5352439.1 glycosyltransferase family 2 protein [Candidatus Omnitrophota bacterium]MDD5550037.1 glycosyltransferase family 2 protein [Candidatus Omnitrophota bacterium]
MYKNSFSFVTPAYNEQENIRKIVGDAYNFLNRNFSDFEIIVVDDGSKDNTPKVCEELTSAYKDKLIVIRHLKNRGYGAALRTGLFSAKKDLVFYTDADNQFDIKEIVNFMPYIDDYDLVIGYRKNRNDVLLRKLCAFVYNRFIFLLFNLNVRDIDCSFKLFKRNSLRRLSIDRDEFFVDTELLLKAKLENLKIKELPVTHFPRRAGKSTVKLSNILATLRDIAYLYPKLRVRK